MRSTSKAHLKTDDFFFLLWTSESGCLIEYYWYRHWHAPGLDRGGLSLPSAKLLVLLGRRLSLLFQLGPSLGVLIIPE